MVEAEVQAAFVAHLRGRGWDVFTENIGHEDVRAVRGAEVIVAEVKGRTTSTGTDIDTGYGQLLRRMTREPSAGDRDVRHALVVPTASLPAAQRVPDEVRTLLSIDLWHVSDDGDVHRL